MLSKYFAVMNLFKRDASLNYTNDLLLEESSSRKVEKSLNCFELFSSMLIELLSLRAATTSSYFLEQIRSSSLLKSFA